MHTEKRYNNLRISNSDYFGNVSARVWVVLVKQTQAAFITESNTREHAVKMHTQVHIATGNGKVYDGNGIRLAVPLDVTFLTTVKPRIYSFVWHW
jgi:hypothetical protein